MMILRLFLRHFKAGLSLAFIFCGLLAFAQYPNAPNKIGLGRQTTGDGLVFRTSGKPAYTPTTAFNAWMALDTTTGNLWTYRAGEWFLEVAGDLRLVYPVVINKSGVDIKQGQVVMIDTVQLVQGDQVRVRPAIATVSNSQFIMGVASTDINNDATGYVSWFGYVREVDHADIAQTGVTLDVGDILYISATQAGRYTDTEPAAPNVNSTIALVVRKPNANNMTLLVRPWLNEKLGDLRDVDLAGLQTGDGIKWNGTKWVAGTFTGADSTIVSAGYGIDVSEVSNNFTVSADTSELATPYDVSLKQDKLTGTGLVKSTSGTISYITDNSTNWDAAYNDRIISAAFSGSGTKTLTLTQQDAGTVTASFTDLQGVTSVTAGTGLSGGTITTSGTIDADTAAVLVSKSFLSNQGYTSNTGTVTSIATGYGLNGGTITTSGTLSVDTAEVATPYDLTLKQDKLNGTAGRIPYFNSPSELLGSNLYYEVAPGNMAPYFGVYQSSPKYPITVNGDPNYGIGIDIKANGPNGNAVMRFSSNTLDTAKARIVATVGAALNFQTGLDTLNRLHIGSDGKIGIGNTSPQRTLHVTGEARITDLTTDTPTQIVGADADGDLGAITVGSGLSLSGGTLSASGSGTVKGTGAANKVAIWASADSLYQNTNLHWDNNNGRLGINNTSPSERLHVGGNVRAERLIVNTFGAQTLSINNYAPAGSDGQNVFIGNGGASLTGTGSSASQNTGIGSGALQRITTGDRNLAIGGDALAYLTSGVVNVGIGGQSGAFITTGVANTYIAARAGLFNTTGSYNTGIGGDALQSIAEGSFNIGIGNSAAGNLTGGSFWNTVIGTLAGAQTAGAANLTTLNNSVYVGADIKASANSITNEIAIGYQAQGQGSNSAIIGNSSITNTYLRGKVSVNTTASANTLDIEGGAAIGATYSGTNTAPTNGLLVEGVFGLGTNILTSGFQMHMYGRKKTELIESNNTTTDKGHEYSNSQTFTTLNTTFNNRFNSTLNGVSMSGNSTVKLNNFGDINQTSYSLLDTANLIYGTNMSIKAKILRQNSNRGLVNKLRYITFDTLDTQGTGTPNINIKRFEGLAIENLTTAPSGITTDTVIGIYIAEQKGGATSAAYSIYSDGGNMYHVGSITTDGTLSRTRFQTFTTATASVGANTTWVICNRAGTITLTLPTASANNGRELTIKTITANTVVSAGPNVVPIDSDVAGTAILPATDGAWALLVSNGTNWVIMQRG